MAPGAWCGVTWFILLSPQPAVRAGSGIHCTFHDPGSSFPGVGDAVGMGRRANSFFLSWMPVSASWHCPRALTDFCPPEGVCVTPFAVFAEPARPGGGGPALACLVVLLLSRQPCWLRCWQGGFKPAPLVVSSASPGNACILAVHTVGLWDSASSLSPARSLQLSVSCCGRPRGRPGPVSADAHLGVDCLSLLVARPISE